MSAKGRRSEAVSVARLGARPRWAHAGYSSSPERHFCRRASPPSKAPPARPSAGTAHCGGSAAVGRPLARFCLNCIVPIHPTHGGPSFLACHAATVSASGQAASSAERSRECHSGGGSVPQGVTQRRGEIRGRLGGDLLAIGAGGDAAFCIRRIVKAAPRFFPEKRKTPLAGSMR